MPSNKTPALDDKSSFCVELEKSVKVGSRTVHPGPRVVLRGDILAGVIAADAAAVKRYTVEPA